MTPPKFHRVASGLYETADKSLELVKLEDVNPPAWNIQYQTDYIDAWINEDPEHRSWHAFEGLVVDGARSKRDALAIFADWWPTRHDDRDVGDLTRA